MSVEQSDYNRLYDAHTLLICKVGAALSFGVDHEAIEKNADLCWLLNSIRDDVEEARLEAEKLLSEACHD